jgi:diaminohydroxyphosphoribosylaminopyrimidine deaminase/5-amino-6-(5-phosphoribosylamino)uracil reductase
MITCQEKALLQLAICQAEHCPSSNLRYRVGCLITTINGEIISKGFTGEHTDSTHAEEAALLNAKEKNISCCNSYLFCSMEPCSSRKSSPLSCSELIIEAKINRVIYAIPEPSHFVTCKGKKLLNEHGITTICYSEFAEKVSEMNSHLPNSVFG